MINIDDKIIEIISQAKSTCVTKEMVDQILVLSDSWNRMSNFLKIQSKLKGILYWQSLRSAYEGSDNLYKHKDVIKQLFKKNEPGRNELMSQDERKVFEKLPSHFTVYRGMTKEEFDSGNFGISWSLSKETAEFFAHKYWRNIDTKNSMKVVKAKKVKKQDCIAYFNGRGEKEIILVFE